MPYKDPVIRAQKSKERNQKFRENKPNYYREYEEKHGHKYTEARRLAHVKRYYGLNAEEYLQLILDQDNKCAICFQPETWTNKRGDVRPLAVDHCHTTGKIRQLLCTRCNAVLGYVKDNPELLQNAIAYLVKHKE